MAKHSGAVVASLCCILLFAFLAGLPAAAADGFETTVYNLVYQAIKGGGYNNAPPNYRVGPALIRLLFHDCWVNGCDGSVLLDKATYSSSKGTEKNAASNLGLGAFDLIDNIKETVGDSASCADIVAFAARDATRILSGGRISYDVSRGRKDGVNSSAVYADAKLPGSTFSFAQLIANFAAEGFDLEDLVVLSGAHSVGVCHYPSFADRIPPPAAAGEIDPAYQGALDADVRRQAGYNANSIEPNNVRDMSPLRNYSAGVNGPLDNSYYAANLYNRVLLKSDWELTQNTTAYGKLVEYKKNATDWNIDFGNAMARLSNLTLPEGQYGEIRKNCRIPNSY